MKDWTYILNEVGEEREHYFQAVSPPIVQSSNFVLPDLPTFRQRFSDELQHHVYTRGNNPTVAILRKKLAAAEEAEDALVLSSGSAAIAAAVLAQVQSGDHIICVQSPYSWTYHLLTKFLPRFGVSCTFVDGTNMESIAAALQPRTKVLYLESPNTLVFALQDLRACAAFAKAHRLISIIDNSYASPYYQNPIAEGIDLVVHSATKYINGHSDVVAGVICGTHTHIRRIFEGEYMTLGAVISPHDAALILRGLRTLPLRMERSDASCKQVIAFLADHPSVAQVIYPHHHTHPQYALALRQMRGCGGLFAFRLKSENTVQLEAFVHRLKIFKMAVSWGGHESLFLPTIAFYDIPGKAQPVLPVNYVRMYIGLEDPAALIADLAQALSVLEEQA